MPSDPSADLPTVALTPVLPAIAFAAIIGLVLGLVVAYAYAFHSRSAGEELTVRQKLQRIWLPYPVIFALAIVITVSVIVSTDPTRSLAQLRIDAIQMGLPMAIGMIATLLVEPCSPFSIFKWPREKRATDHDLP